MSKEYYLTQGDPQTQHEFQTWGNLTPLEKELSKTFSTRSIYEKNDGPALESIGYQALVTGDLTSLHKGDIIIFQPSNASAAGHIEMWTGTQFISDWKQGTNFYPNVNNTCAYPSFTVYRYPGN